jgi:hypothetical protein
LGLIEIIIAALLSVIAIVLAIALKGIIIREYGWQKRYVEMVKRAEGNNPLLYQLRRDYKPLPGCDIPSTFSVITWFVIIAWLLFVIAVVIFWTQFKA